jgi:hypothetical protein
VVAVQRGGPAWRYGVRIGHRMESFEREIGSMVIVFTVDGQKVTKRIPTGDICQDAA